ncbi:hypothetical protein GQ53DRAFT_769085 [Thozetella sp. PMI_491]|nr:hypothetical protein GQ53DRAFT_769085 [Thozetella sp. PMI_491]
MRCLQYNLVILSACFGLGVSMPVRYPIATRAKADVAPLLAGVTTVTTSVANLDVSINSLSVGNIAGLTAVVQNSNTVQQSLVSATSRAQEVQGVLKAADANQLRDQVEPLVATTQATIQDLISKQAIIAATGATSTTLNVLMGQKTAATNFANALQVKVPASKQKTAAGLAADVAGAFDQGIAAFSAPAAAAPLSLGAKAVDMSTVIAGSDAGSSGRRDMRQRQKEKAE